MAYGPFNVGGGDTSLDARLAAAEKTANNAMPKSGGEFTGTVAAAAAGQAADSYLLRNSKLSADEETPTVEGQICWQYE